MVIMYPYCLILVLLPLVSHALKHPGGWHTVADIQRIRTKLSQGLEPWASAYSNLMSDGPNYDAQPSAVSIVYRGGDTNNSGLNNLQYDAVKAYTLMIKWIATNDSRYGDAAIRFLDVWSGTLKNISGFDARLAAGIYGNKLAQAAELAAYYRPNWSNKARLQKILLSIFYPIITIGGPYGWSTSCMAGMMSIAVFCDNQTMFDRVINAYTNGEKSPTHFPWNPDFGVTSDGLHSVAQYIDSTGQVAEAGRDQGHSSLAIGQYLQTAVSAYNQGKNLLSLFNNRLVAGFEYVAKYHLNQSVPYHVYRDEVANITGIWTSTSISSDSRFGIYPIYEMAWAYFQKIGVSAPYTKAAVMSKGYAPETRWNTDHPGLGTLTMRQ